MVPILALCRSDLNLPIGPRLAERIAVYLSSGRPATFIDLDPSGQFAERLLPASVKHGMEPTLADALQRRADAFDTLTAVRQLFLGPTGEVTSTTLVIVARPGNLRARPDDIVPAMSSCLAQFGTLAPSIGSGTLVVTAPPLPDALSQPALNSSSLAVLFSEQGSTIESARAGFLGISGVTDSRVLQVVIEYGLDPGFRLELTEDEDPLKARRSFLALSARQPVRPSPEDEGAIFRMTAYLAKRMGPPQASWWLRRTFGKRRKLTPVDARGDQTEKGG